MIGAGFAAMGSSLASLNNSLSTFRCLPTDEDPRSGSHHLRHLIWAGPRPPSGSMVARSKSTVKPKISARGRQRKEHCADRELKKSVRPAAPDEWAHLYS
jgi:hypothetical protein